MQAREAIGRLQHLAPNTALNSRCPWKGCKDITRMWCPVHGGWVRLLVSSDESGEAIFQCESHCAQSEIEMFIFDAGARHQNWRQRPFDDKPEFVM